MENAVSSASAIEPVERDAILDALAAVEHRIDDACERSGRARETVTLLPVTKTVPAERIAVAVEAGYRQLGENRVQEAAEKSESLAWHGIEWHLIGHLQRNKVKQALDFVHCIESVDRQALVERLARQLEAREARCEVLLQVNTSGADSQFGVTPGEAPPLAAAIAAESSLELRGLMTIGRLVEDPGDARDCFRTLRELRDRLRDDLGLELPVLSMGMTADLEVAIDEGATRVRVGSAIFGARTRPL